jgi:hypothetical protein
MGKKHLIKEKKKKKEKERKRKIKRMPSFPDHMNRE